LLVAGLEPWHPGLRRGINRPSRALKARRKLYAEDHGFIPAFSPFASPMSRDGVRARVFETVVFTHLRALRESRHDFGLYYFRERDTTEMDFVLDFEDAALGVEVTSGKTPQKKVASASRAAARAGLDRVILVHGGPLSRQDFDGGTALPLDAFLLDPRAAVEDALEWVRRSR
jgi:predicted AAA+ superfamily ATPase